MSPFLPSVVRELSMRAVLTVLVGTLMVLATGCSGCTDEVGEGEDCPSGYEWNPEQDRCLERANGGSDAGGGDTFGGDDSGGGDDGGNGGGPCVGLECDQVACPQGEPVTTISGTVTIPSGELPLPNVTVYVPNAPLDPIPDGASCTRCEDMVSGSPLVQTITDMHGNFLLENVPVAEEVPLVIQTGKWRREVTITGIQECTDNPITDPQLTRLPRNQSEGHIPRMAVTNGGWDALECLIYKLGIDDQEFTSANDDSGRVTLYYHGGGADSFASWFNGGEALTEASIFWGHENNLMQYDTLVYSCEYPYASAQARQALQSYVDQGGRAFMNDLHREWFETGDNNFGQVATWNQNELWPPLGQMQARLDVSVPGGGLMYDWMNALGRLDASGEFTVYDIVKNIDGVNTDVAERWVYSPYSSQGERDLYFAFNTPIGAAEEDQCGRVVYSDLHIVAAGGSEPGYPFPDGCSTGALTPQEEALIYMFFDLTACIDPECVPLNCSDVYGECGTHPNGCGGTLDCGDCPCRPDGEPCTSNDQCCSGTCSGRGGDEGVCLSG